VGIRDVVKRLTATVDELDAVRLQDRYTGLGLTSLADLPLRTPVRVGGEIQRIRLVPVASIPTVELTVADGTGEVVAVFLGRRTIGGVHTGRGVLLEGVARPMRGRAAIVNPAYTLLPGPGD
jgi:hypothetical protein